MPSISLKESRSSTTSRTESPDVRISAIDIGSNSIRQIIADVSSTGTIRVVDEMKAAPRLGSGIQETGELSRDASDAAIEALGRMEALARQLGARRTRAVATSAVRDASNSGEWIGRVKLETGIDVVVLRGEDEARLSFRSAQAHFDLETGRAAVIDIGINQIDGPNGEVQIVGDVDTEAVKEVASWVTPVPGGVGPVTVAMFMRNAITAHNKQLSAGWLG
jgi:exopolyphosphatase/guanosine-5'-triphosphate,3'-diphosphate pyrophosphatase